MALQRRVLTRFRPSIRSRHPSHSILRRQHRNLPLFPFRTLVRLGSTNEPDNDHMYAVVVNSVESIRTSANKLKMKEAFERAEVRTAPWFTVNNTQELLSTADQVTQGWQGKLVCKAIYGSRGRGNTLVSSQEELQNWINTKEGGYGQYIFEKYMPYALEYRIHVTERGYFYTCRKALRQDVPEDQRWRRHDDICVWFLEENVENFKKPNSFADIVNDCVKALKEVGADVLSFDVRVQGATANGVPREYQDYILLECNSASSMGNPNDNGELSVCAQKYIEELPLIINNKWRAR